MRILLTGAYGFIGSHLAARLSGDGHHVVGCGRDLALGRRTAPQVQWVRCDLNRDTTAEAWLPRLAGVDAVVNAAGILQASRRDDVDAIHFHAPAALFDACTMSGVRRVVQISALGVAADTAYAASKRAADRHLMALELDWVVLRPSLVYARSCYGGTTLFRALAAAPFLVPLPGAGDQRFQPIHIADLAAAVARLVQPDAPSRVVLSPVGPEVMTLRDIVLTLRRWLGFPARVVLPVPMPLVRLAARLGDLAHWFGFRGSLRSTALRQMAFGSTADVAPFVDAAGFAPRRMADALAAEPAGVQERWHARLIPLRPLLRLTLGSVWIASGLIAAFEPGHGAARALLVEAGLAGSAVAPALWGGIVADVGLGLLVLLRRHVRLAGAAMIVLTLAYLAAASLTLPGLWTDPLGPLVKTLPMIAATLAMMAIEDDR